MPGWKTYAGILMTGISVISRFEFINTYPNKSRYTLENLILKK